MAGAGPSTHWRFRIHQRRPCFSRVSGIVNRVCEAESTVDTYVRGVHTYVRTVLRTQGSVVQKQQAGRDKRASCSKRLRKRKSTRDRSILAMMYGST